MVFSLKPRSAVWLTTDYIEVVRGAVGIEDSDELDSKSIKIDGKILILKQLKGKPAFSNKISLKYKKKLAYE